MIISVLESLRQQMAAFTLSSVIDEVLRWCETGKSCFDKLLQKFQLPPPEQSLLELLLPSSSD